MNVLIFISVIALLQGTHSLPEQGKWTLETRPGNEYVGVSKSLFKGSHINVKIRCSSSDTKETLPIEISWALRKTPCWNEASYFAQDESGWYPKLYEFPNSSLNYSKGESHKPSSMKVPPYLYNCDESIILKLESKSDTQALLFPNSDTEAKAKQISKMPVDPLVNETKRAVKDGTSATSTDHLHGKLTSVQNNDLTVNVIEPESVVGMSNTQKTTHTVAIVPADGIYLLIIHTKMLPNHSYTTSIDVEMLGSYGYLSAANWPFLPFYCSMCIIYVFYGLIWLTICFLRWRELLRVQYWIGAVILLGMMEKAMFTAEYQSINSRGYSIRGLIIAAEIVSCAKRTLARMLVIVVSSGFGIVKPRLGIMLNRIVGLGLLYFVLASIESCSRALKPVTDHTNESMLNVVPLALIDACICWWVFTALVQTTRTLRLRRNTIKLSLYQHFTNTLAFAVVASIIFKVWVVLYQQMQDCLTDWKELWVTEAFWHVLFVIILLVIMILWRPTNNNQRFAFSPLLDDGSDAENEENEKFLGDATDTMKQRNLKPSKVSPKESRTVEDDLKWVEENIPSSITDSALPILDSDEEILTTKFEISKMQ